MKNFIFFILLFFLILEIGGVSALCINTLDNYALEILLNKPGTSYNLEMLNNAKNVVVKDNKYIMQSEYNSDIAVILEEVSSTPSVRLQIPVKAEEKALPYLQLLSRVKGTLNISNQEYYNNWKISCVQGAPPAQCEFIKGKTNILASLIKDYEIEIETREELKDCKGCDGKCLSTNPARCLNAQLKNDIESVLKYSGLISSMDEFFSSYKIVSFGNAIVTDLTPEKNLDIDWQEAIRQELVRLKSLAVISLSHTDIEVIARLARQGAAGQNFRIVYGEDNNNTQKWLYYYQTKFALLTKLENCQEFLSSAMPTGMLIFSEQKISTYYLVPLILTSVLLFLLIMLLIIARIITNKRRKRKLS